MNRILILYTQKPQILSFMPKLEEKLKNRQMYSRSFIIHPASKLDQETREEIHQILPTMDLVICLGGDGTVLSAAQLIYTFNIPILPINFGQLGFIAEGTEPENIDMILEEIVKKTFIEENRTLINISLCNNAQNWIALNEAYVGSNHYHKVGYFSILVDGYSVSQYKADGILLSTATGSTGYNLSAGGPILHPALDVFVLTSVIPHKITHRPLVLPCTANIEISLANEFSQSLIIDGQHKAEIQPNDCITIKKSEYSLTLLYSSSRNYFKSLKEKLNWMV